MLERSQLHGLLEQARSNNARVDITSCLLYGSGNFLQLLEGPREQVQATFSKISRDDRHRDIRLLLDADRERCTFNTWWMAFFNLETGTRVSIGWTTSSIRRLMGSMKTRWRCTACSRIFVPN